MKSTRTAQRGWRSERASAMLCGTVNGELDSLRSATHPHLAEGPQRSCTPLRLSRTRSPELCKLRYLENLAQHPAWREVDRVLLPPTSAASQMTDRIVIGGIPRAYVADYCPQSVARCRPVAALPHADTMQRGTQKLEWRRCWPRSRSRTTRPNSARDASFSTTVSSIGLWRHYARIGHITSGTCKVAGHSG